MHLDTDFHGLRVAVTGGTSGLGLALVRRLKARGARVAFVARTAAAVQAPPGTPPPSASSATSARKADIHPIALQITAQPRRPRRPDQRRLQPRPGAAGAPRRHRVRGAGAGARGQPRSAPFRLTKALYGALAASAREGRGALVVNISSDAAVNAYPGWGAYGASKAALAHLTAIWADRGRRPTASASSRSTPATWTRRCTRWPCPTPTRRR